MSPIEQSELNEESLKAAAWYLDVTGFPKQDVVAYQARLNDIAIGFFMGWREAIKTLKEVVEKK